MYRFKLQALLSHRRHQEEVCQKELAEAQRVLTDAREKLRRLEKDKRENIEKLKARQQEPHSISNILIFINYIDQLSRDMEAQMLKVDRASKNVNQKRDNVIAIMKKRKTLEKLKEKQWLEYQHKLMQAERKFNDEVAATRHIRKR
jgi:flagellar FliJ protein